MVFSRTRPRAIALSQARTAAANVPGLFAISQDFGRSCFPTKSRSRCGCMTLFGLMMKPARRSFQATVRMALRSRFLGAFAPRTSSRYVHACVCPRSADRTSLSTSCWQIAGLFFQPDGSRVTPVGHPPPPGPRTRSATVEATKLTNSSWSSRFSRGRRCVSPSSSPSGGPSSGQGLPSAAAGISAASCRFPRAPPPG